MTKPILQAVVKLLTLLSVMPWNVMVEFLQQLRSGRVDRSGWTVPRHSVAGRDDAKNRAMLLFQDAMSGTAWFDKWLYQAIYWYLIEQIAKQLKSGELRNAKIYEFNSDAVYNQARGTKNQELVPTGIPPPGEKDIEEKSLTKLSHLKRRTRLNFPQQSKPPASLPVCNHFKFSNAKTTASPGSSATSAPNRTDIQIKY